MHSTVTESKLFIINVWGCNIERGVCVFGVYQGVRGKHPKGVEKSLVRTNYELEQPSAALG